MLERILNILKFMQNIPIDKLFYIICALFWFIGTFEFVRNSITIRNDIEYLPFILGLIFLLLGLLFSFKLNLRRNKKIVFYSPTIKKNPFFHELLDQVVEIASLKNIEVITKKGITSVDYHHVEDYYDILTSYKNIDYKNTVIIMVPPSPKSYERIFELDPNIKINLITLDMELRKEDSDKFKKCNFLKKVILLNNEKGSNLAAEEVVYYCSTSNIKDINIITCEGEFHDRGMYFSEAVKQKGRDKGIKVNFLGKLEKRSFSNAVNEAYNYVDKTLKTYEKNIKAKATFIFCANDNMAIGAKSALSKFESSLIENIKIISFDASDIIRTYVELEDKHILCSIDQKYNEYAQTAVKYAEMILNGKETEREVVYITPGIKR